MKKKKMVVLGTIGTLALIAATVIPIVLINQKKDEEKDEKEIVTYSNKLKALSEKSVKIIALNTESITDKKAEILAAIKLLTNFPKLPTGISLEVKDDATKIVKNKEVGVTLIVKQEGETNIEIEGFKVKSFTDQEIVDDYANKLKAFTTKEVQIASTIGTVTGKKSEIITSLKALKDFPKLPNNVTLDVKDAAIDLTIQGIPITLIVKKGQVDKEVQGFSASRSATDQEKVDVYKATLLLALTLIDSANPNFKYLKIENNSGDVTANKSQILTKLKERSNTIFGANNLLSDAALTLVEMELDVKDDATAITKEGIPITVQLKKGAAVAEFDGAEDSFQFFVKRSLTRAESNTEMGEYLRSVNNKIFVSSSDSTANAGEILTAVKKAIGNNLAEETKNLLVSKTGQPTSLTTGTETSIEYDFAGGTVILSVTKIDLDMKAIIDYFAQESEKGIPLADKKKLIIPSATTISDKATLTTAIQEALKADNPRLFDDTKKLYVTLPSDYTYSALTQGTPQDVVVKIQKGSEPAESITLSIMHNTAGFDAVSDYLETNYSYFISNTTATSSRAEILTALKNAIGDGLTPQQKNLIQTRNRSDSSLAAGTSKFFEFKIVGGRGGNIVKITKRSADAQAIIDYFAQESEKGIPLADKKKLIIPSATTISDKATLTTAIQEALKADDSSLFDDTKKLYVTLPSDYTYSALTQGTAQDVKVQIQKGSETPEFITLSIMHNTAGFDTVSGYLETNYSYFISNTTATSNRAEILAALKNAIGDGLTPQQKNLIQIRNRSDSSLAAGASNFFEFKIAGGRGGNIVRIIKRSADAQAIIDYFAQAGKKDLSIPPETPISDKVTLTTAIQEALKADNPRLFDDTKKLYVTLPSDYTYSAFTSGTAQDVKVQIQKSSETPEFITLSVTHNAPDSE